MRAKVGICIPWRPSPSRVAAFDVTMRMFKEQFPDIEIYLGDEPRALHFNLSAARNAACEAALADGCSILVVADADVLPVRSSIEKALRVIQGGEDFVVAHNSLRYLSESASVDVLNGREWDDTDYAKSGAWCTGVIVISEKCFRALNGWDERFLSWGQEDDAFYYSYKAIFKKEPAKVDGPLYTLYHSDRDMTYSKKNMELVSKYRQNLEKSKEDLINHLLRNRLNWD